MDEREKFEKWFAHLYGRRPEGDLAELRDELEGISSTIEAIRFWEERHQVALNAWREGLESGKSAAKEASKKE